MCLKTGFYSLFGQLEFCLIFILTRNNDFQSGALVKMLPSSPSLEESDLDIQKKISLKQAKIYLSRYNKNTLKNAGWMSTSTIMRLFASQDIRYNNSLNTKVQKKNETEIKKIQTKVVTKWFFRFIAIYFSNRHQVFLNFW